MPGGAELSHLCHYNLSIIYEIGTWNQNCCSTNVGAIVSGTRIFLECVVFSCYQCFVLSAVVESKEQYSVW